MNGQLGKHGKVRSHSSIIVHALNPYKIMNVFAGFCHSFALSEDGALYCWGDNITNQLGMNLTQKNLYRRFTTEPYRQDQFGSTVAQVYTSCCAYHSFVLLSTGEIYAMGSNNNGQFGLGEVGTRKEAVMLNGRHGSFWNDKCIVQLAVGGYLTMALLSQKSLLEIRLNQNIYAFSDTNFHFK